MAKVTKKEKPFRSFNMLRYHRLFWYVYAIRPSDPNLHSFWRKLYKGYQILFHILISVYYPVSMFVGVFELGSSRLIMENCCMSFQLAMCTVKAFFIWSNMEGLERCKSICDKMDDKANADPYTFSILIAFKRKVKALTIPYFLMYTTNVITPLLGIMLITEKRLLYPAYFPFDWKADNIYKAVIFYQWIGLWLQTYLNLIYHTFMPMVMCLLTQNLQVLSIRISKIGTDPKKSKRDNHEDLKVAIKDHKEILQFYNDLKKLESPTALGMFLIAGLTINLSLILILYYAESWIEMLYFVVYIIGNLGQIYFECYYGTAFQEECNNLTKAIFACNWVEQTKEFTQDLKIFQQNSLRRNEFTAGGVMTISLNGFLQLMKSSYSLFAVLNHMRK